MISLTTFTLNNGLRVVHNFHPQAVLSAVEIVYRTGARDESPESTGLAHLFEHLMFGGTPAVPDFDAALQAAGGISNAATSSDYTYFYDILPVQNIETAFWLESDRMRGLSFSERSLKVQRHVVVEEFKETQLNTPYGSVQHTLLPLLYPTHPYRWPVIGVKPEHIEKVTIEKVKDWFAGHYTPNNAILTVVGNISAERVKLLAEKYFAPIPSRELNPPVRPHDPWLTATKQTTIYDRVPQTQITIGYRMDAFGTRGYLAADAISDILSNGKSSRLQQRLVRDKQIFTLVDASISGSEDSGVFYLTGRVAENSDAAIEIARDALIAEAQALALNDTATEEELQRAKNIYESTLTFSNITAANKAHNISMAQLFGEDINSKAAAYRSLTLREIATEARRLFVDHSPAIVVCRPLP